VIERSGCHDNIIFGNVCDVEPSLQGTAKAGNGAVEYFNDVLAVDTNHVVAAEDLTAGLPITCTLAAQPDVPRNVTITVTDGDTGISAFTITVTGVKAKGFGSGTANTTEVFVFAGGLVQVGVEAFSTITSVVVSGLVGDGAGDTLDVGIGSKLGLANVIYATTDVYKVKKNNADLAVAGYTVNATYDTVDVSTGGAITGGDDFAIWYKNHQNVIF